MIDEVSFKAAGLELTLCFTARARYLFEQQAGYPLTSLKLLDPDTSDVSDVEVAQAVWAGLEGHRVRSKDRKLPWSIEEVLDDVLADLPAPDRLPVHEAIVRAVGAAFRGAVSAPEGAAGAEGKVPPAI